MRSETDHGKWSQVSDTFLLEVLQGDDLEDIAAVMSMLQGKNSVDLRRYARSRLRSSRDEDVVEDVWLLFYERAVTGRIELEMGLRPYLFGIARNLIIEANKRLKREVDIELNQLSERYSGPSAEEQFEEEEELARQRLQIDHLRELPYLNRVLSDCERVLLTLRNEYGYQVQAIARLLDKTANNASQYLFQARARVLEYAGSEDLEIALDAREHPRHWAPPGLEEDAEVIERFSERLIPRLRPEELEPLGLSIDELKSGYVASLMIPRWYPKFGESLPPSLPYLLLARRKDWPTFASIHGRLSADPDYLPDEFPEETLIKLDVQGNHITLGAVTAFQIVPEDPEGERMGNTYLGIHSSGRRVPVIMAIIGSELYDDAFRERWPFLEPGWEEREPGDSAV